MHREESSVMVLGLSGFFNLIASCPGDLAEIDHFFAYNQVITINRLVFVTYDTPILVKAL